MESAIKTMKLMLPAFLGCFISLVLPINNAHAGYLIPPVPVQVVPVQVIECDQCSYRHARPHYRKHPHAAYKHHRRYRPAYHCRGAAILCPYHRRCEAPHDFVTFIGDPAPIGRGRWVNTDEYDNYDPDMSTGDDDPTIYPGMNINN